MRKQIALTILVALLASASAPARAAETGAPQVMIVGVAHLEARRDVHNSAFQDSPLSPERQAQSAEVVRRLARFRPTKVLIEAPMGDPRFPERYRQFLAGRLALSGAAARRSAPSTTARYAMLGDEVYQYGFKLAARAGNRTIYPIDTFGPALLTDDPRIDDYLKTHFARVKDSVSDAYVARDDALERHGTYLDVLRYLNSDAAIRANASWYGVFDGMGRDAHDAGASYVAQWYARNCYIFANIASVVRPGDRVVVIIGQGHEYLLREFTRLDPHMTFVDALRYLE